jgi:hypothetical protein
MGLLSSRTCLVLVTCRQPESLKSFALPCASTVPPCASVQFVLLAAAAQLRTSAILPRRTLERTKEYDSTENLYRLSALVRAEVHKVCQVPVPAEDAMAAE